MEYEDNPSSIKYHVKKYLKKNAERFTGKKVVDFPAGNGITTRIIQEIGGEPFPFDLFPEYFELSELECKRANINTGIPLEDKFADVVICQEGIEHFSDQINALREFNRILKPSGTLIITTPNYSNLRGKMSHFLSESERFITYMAPNELDSIWMLNGDPSKEIYFGHIFLIGILKLRCLAKLAGFKIKHIQFTRIKSTSLFFLIFFYPFILVSNWITYWKNLRKNNDYDLETKKATYKEILKLSINPKILVDGHLFVEFEKEIDADKVGETLKGKDKTTIF